MKKSDVFNEIKKFLDNKWIAPKDRILDMNTRFIEDLAMDSLDMLDLFVSLEKKYGLTPLDERSVQYITINDLVVAVEKSIERKNIKVFPPKGAGHFYLFNKNPYCLFTDKPCGKIDMMQVSNSMVNQCKRMKCQIFERQKNQRTK